MQNCLLKRSLKMKKIEKLMREDFEKNVQPKFDADFYDRLHAKVEETVEKRKAEKNVVSKKANVNLWKRFAIACCCLLVILPCVLVPTLWPSKPDQSFYGDDEVTQTELEQTYAEEYFAQHFPQYSFIFEDCTIDHLYGYYENKSNSLLAFSLILQKNDIPFTNVEFNLILSKRYKFGKHDEYIDGAEISKRKEYTLYKKYVSNMDENEIWSLLDYTKFKLYLSLEIADEEFFEKFL